MHTLDKRDNDLWAVVFSFPSGNHSTIEDNLSKADAMELVNYLNGGTGDRPRILQELVNVCTGIV